MARLTSLGSVGGGGGGGGVADDRYNRTVVKWIGQVCYNAMTVLRTGQ